MKKYYAFIAAITALMAFSCNKTEIVQESYDSNLVHSNKVLTKAIGDKEPSTFVYVETNDVNPLNAMDYYTDSGIPFFDYIGFFAANIHFNSSNSQPTLYLNPELTPYLCNNGSPVTTYTEANIMGASSLSIYVSEELKAYINGDSSLSYKGNCKAKIDASGESIINHIE